MEVASTRLAQAAGIATVLARLSVPGGGTRTVKAGASGPGRSDIGGGTRDSKWQRRRWSRVSGWIIGGRYVKRGPQHDLVQDRSSRSEGLESQQVGGDGSKRAPLERAGDHFTESIGRGSDRLVVEVIGNGDKPGCDDMTGAGAGTQEVSKAVPTGERSKIEAEEVVPFARDNKLLTELTEGTAMVLIVITGVKFPAKRVVLRLGRVGV